MNAGPKRGSSAITAPCWSRSIARTWHAVPVMARTVARLTECCRRRGSGDDDAGARQVPHRIAAAVDAVAVRAHTEAREVRARLAVGVLELHADRLRRAVHV